ncbi:putative cytochrome P450 [Lyophyllum shimeji]|uniref:Cytochrome P450 n=1 Tax=Lyophyllum shimeji TaxID=47721 RepID=A0A9P3PP04_LYOSH|nr:putative cytochrome P450 [Lyophyllum shimeji]
MARPLKSKAPSACEDILMTGDHLAFQHVIDKAGYDYPKAREETKFLYQVTGNSIVTVGAHAHQRQRKIMNPAFSERQMQRFVPLFQSIATRLTRGIMSQLEVDPQKEIEIRGWLGRASLESIGYSVFGYEFNALEDENCEMAHALHHLLDGAAKTSAALRTMIWAYVNVPYFDAAMGLLSKIVPNPAAESAAHYKRITREVGSKVLLSEGAVSNAEGFEKDIMSILIKANSSTDKEKAMDDDEVLSQGSSFIAGGTDSTSAQLAWALFELAKLPDVQQALREEIAAARNRLPDGDISQMDYDALPWLNAVLKEVLRYHPTTVFLNREAAKDDVIPLAEPIMATTGEMIDRVPVRKGQLISFAVHISGRLSSVYGEDAHVFRPSRWFEKMNDKVSLGHYSNLAAFSGGVRGCIGWRWGIIEMQVTLAELIENFRFELPANWRDIKRSPCITLPPMIRGKEAAGSQLPLKVIPL